MTRYCTMKRMKDMKFKASSFMSSMRFMVHTNA